MKRLVLATALASLLSALPALAQVTVKDPWVRATVPAQTATGAFMTLTAGEEARLVAARSPLAKVVEIHEMKMEGGVMKMRPVGSLTLPAGKPVSLDPGGYHLMLMGLKQQVKAGDTVPLTLVVETQGGKKSEIEVKATAKPLAESGHMHQH